MKFEEYIGLAMRTLPDGREVGDNLLNMCLGLAGEFAEYQIVKEEGTQEDKIDELGDLYWYTALGAYALEYRGDIKETDSTMIKVIGGLCDYVKKAVFQGHNMYEEVTHEILGNLLYRLEEEAKSIGVSSSEVMEYNVAKLKKRFPQGFEIGRSVNRKA